MYKANTFTKPSRFKMYNNNKLIFCDRNYVRSRIIHMLCKIYLYSDKISTLEDRLNFLGKMCQSLYGEDIRKTVDDSNNFYKASNYREWIDYLYSQYSNNKDFPIFTFDSEREKEMWCNIIYQNAPSKLIEGITHNPNSYLDKSDIIDKLLHALSKCTFEYLGVDYQMSLWRVWLPLLIQKWNSVMTDFEAFGRDD